MHSSWPFFYYRKYRNGFRRQSRCFRGAFELGSLSNENINIDSGGFGVFLNPSRDVPTAFERQSKDSNGNRNAFEVHSTDSDGILSAFELDSFSTENIEIDSGGNRDAFLHPSRDVPTVFEPHSSGNLKISTTFEVHSCWVLLVPKISK